MPVDIRFTVPVGSKLKVKKDIIFTNPADGATYKVPAGSKMSYDSFLPGKTEYECILPNGETIKIPKTYTDDVDNPDTFLQWELPGGTAMPRLAAVGEYIVPGDFAAKHTWSPEQHAIDKGTKKLRRILQKIFNGQHGARGSLQYPVDDSIVMMLHKGEATIELYDQPAPEGSFAVKKKGGDYLGVYEPQYNPAKDDYFIASKPGPPKGKKISTLSLSDLEKGRKKAKLLACHELIDQDKHLAGLGTLTASQIIEDIQRLKCGEPARYRPAGVVDDHAYEKMLEPLASYVMHGWPDRQLWDAEGRALDPPRDRLLRSVTFPKLTGGSQDFHRFFNVDYGVYSKATDFRSEAERKALLEKFKNTIKLALIYEEQTAPNDPSKKKAIDFVTPFAFFKGLDDTIKDADGLSLNERVRMLFGEAAAEAVAELEQMDPKYVKGICLHDDAKGTVMKGFSKSGHKIKKTAVFYGTNFDSGSLHTALKDQGWDVADSIMAEGCGPVGNGAVGPYANRAKDEADCRRSMGTSNMIGMPKYNGLLEGENCYDISFKDSKAKQKKVAKFPDGPVAAPVGSPKPGGDSSHELQKISGEIATAAAIAEEPKVSSSRGTIYLTCNDENSLAKILEIWRPKMRVDIETVNEGGKIRYRMKVGNKERLERIWGSIHAHNITKSIGVKHSDIKKVSRQPNGKYKISCNDSAKAKLAAKDSSLKWTSKGGVPEVEINHRQLLAFRGGDSPPIVPKPARGISRVDASTRKRALQMGVADAIAAKGFPYPFVFLNHEGPKAFFVLSVKKEKADQYRGKFVGDGITEEEGGKYFKVKIPLEKMKDFLPTFRFDDFKDVLEKPVVEVTEIAIVKAMGGTLVKDGRQDVVSFDTKEEAEAFAKKITEEPYGITSFTNKGEPKKPYSINHDSKPPYGIRLTNTDFRKLKGEKAEYDAQPADVPKVCHYFKEGEGRYASSKTLLKDIEDYAQGKPIAIDKKLLVKVAHDFFKQSETRSIKGFLKEKYPHIKDKAVLRSLESNIDNLIRYNRMASYARARKAMDDPQKLKQLKSEAQKNIAKWKGGEVASTVEVVGGDWGAEATAMAKKYGAVPAALNMASAHTLGGGVRDGCPAQEENMARVSTLMTTAESGQMSPLPAEYADSPFLNDHYNSRYSADVNGAILHKGLVRFRGSEGVDGTYTDLPDSEITEFNELRSAAVDLRGSIDVKGKVREKDETTGFYIPTEEDKKEMQRRIDKQLDVSIAGKQEYLLLSAFGCGAFGWDATAVANMYKKAIEARPGKFKAIRFAIFNPGYGPDNLTPFRDVLKDVKLGAKAAARDRPPGKRPPQEPPQPKSPAARKPVAVPPPDVAARTTSGGIKDFAKVLDKDAKKSSPVIRNVKEDRDSAGNPVVEFEVQKRNKKFAKAKAWAEKSTKKDEDITKVAFSDKKDADEVAIRNSIEKLAESGHYQIEIYSNYGMEFAQKAYQIAYEHYLANRDKMQEPVLEGGLDFDVAPYKKAAAAAVEGVEADSIDKGPAAPGLRSDELGEEMKQYLLKEGLQSYDNFRRKFKTSNPIPALRIFKLGVEEAMLDHEVIEKYKDNIELLDSFAKGIGIDDSYYPSKSKHYLELRAAKISDSSAEQAQGPAGPAKPPGKALRFSGGSPAESPKPPKSPKPPLPNPDDPDAVAKSLHGKLLAFMKFLKAKGKSHEFGPTKPNPLNAYIEIAVGLRTDDPARKKIWDEFLKENPSQKFSEAERKALEDSVKSGGYTVLEEHDDLLEKFFKAKSKEGSKLGKLYADKIKELGEDKAFIWFKERLAFNARYKVCYLDGSRVDARDPNDVLGKKISTGINKKELLELVGTDKDDTGIYKEYLTQEELGLSHLLLPVASFALPYGNGVRPRDASSDTLDHLIQEFESSSPSSMVISYPAGIELRGGNTMHPDLLMCGAFYTGDSLGRDSKRQQMLGNEAFKQAAIKLYGDIVTKEVEVKDGIPHVDGKELPEHKYIKSTISGKSFFLLEEPTKIRIRHTLRQVLLAQDAKMTAPGSFNFKGIGLGVFGFWDGQNPELEKWVVEALQEEVEQLQFKNITQINLVNMPQDLQTHKLKVALPDKEVASGEILVAMDASVANSMVYSVLDKTGKEIHGKVTATDLGCASGSFSDPIRLNKDLEIKMVNYLVKKGIIHDDAYSLERKSDFIRSCGEVKSEGVPIKRFIMNPMAEGNEETGVIRGTVVCGDAGSAVGNEANFNTPRSSSDDPSSLVAVHHEAMLPKSINEHGHIPAGIEAGKPIPADVIEAPKAKAAARPK